MNLGSSFQLGLIQFTPLSYLLSKGFSFLILLSLIYFHISDSEFFRLSAKGTEYYILSTSRQ